MTAGYNLHEALESPGFSRGEDVNAIPTTRLTVVQHPWISGPRVCWINLVDDEITADQEPFRQLYQLVLKRQSLAMDVYRSVLNR